MINGVEGSGRIQHYTDHPMSAIERAKCRLEFLKEQFQFHGFSDKQIGTSFRELDDMYFAIRFTTIFSIILETKGMLDTDLKFFNSCLSMLAFLMRGRTIAV